MVTDKFSLQNNIKKNTPFTDFISEDPDPYKGLDLLSWYA